MFSQNGSKINILYCLYNIYTVYITTQVLLTFPGPNLETGWRKGKSFRSCVAYLLEYIYMLVMSVAPLSAPSSNMTIQQKNMLSVFSMFQNPRLQAGKLSLSDYSSAIPHLSALHCCLLHPMVCHPPNIPHPQHRQKEAKPILVNEDLDQSSP